ncbi:hypothetical protein C8R44DRAFT_730303 [Mycena epipterygia]|nr:hypothetical protein C8R44DRAFT_730303 [Mycena epipterygia]
MSMSTEFWVTNHATATYLDPGVPIEDRFLGVYMSRSWASFAATGDPNNTNGQYNHDYTTWHDWDCDDENQLAEILGRWAGHRVADPQTQGETMLEKDTFRDDGMQFMIDNIFFWNSELGSILNLPAPYASDGETAIAGIILDLQWIYHSVMAV